MRELKRKIKIKIDTARIRDKKYGIHTKTIETYEVLYLLMMQEYKCFYCNKMMLLNNNTSHKDSFTCDRIDNDEGHHRSNIVMSCLGCNNKRMNNKCLPLHKLIPIV